MSQHDKELLVDLAIGLVLGLAVSAPLMWFITWVGS